MPVLVLTRRPGERIHIGEDILLHVVRIQGGRVRIGIDAPAHCRVIRAELLERETAADPRQFQRAEPIPV